MPTLFVYDKSTRQDDFNNCGLGILKPSKFQTYEELNGDYSVSIQYPITKQDIMWQYLTPYNIVKNSEGQLFMLHTFETSMSGGKAVMNAAGRHISYYLADKNVGPIDYSGANGWWALHEILSDDKIEKNWDYEDPDHHDDSLVDYTFTWASDIEETHDIKYEKINPYYAIAGAENSVLTLYGGELHRDNFYISVNYRKEGSRDNAFKIEHGVNMLEIRERISVQNLVTGVWATDNFGNWKWRVRQKQYISPHQVLKHLQYSYSDNSTLNKDVDDYFNSHLDPDVSYEVRFKDLRSNERYKDWMALQTLKVGDTGTVKCSMLGIEVEQKIISRTINDITGETEAITLGNFMPDMFKGTRYSNLIARDSSSTRRLNALEARNQTQ